MANTALATPAGDTAAGAITVDDGERILCPCADLTVAGLRDMVADGAASFEALLETSAPNGVTIGGRCTACRLDLELLFTDFLRAAPKNAKHARHSVNRHDERGLKQRVYGVIDNLTPPVAMELWNSAPILVGPQINETLTVANDSMMFEGAEVAPEMEVEVRVRDGEGLLRYCERHRIEAGTALETGLSEHLEAPTGGRLGLGSLEVTRRAFTPGHRGTTRPQIVIESAAGLCAVHTQASLGPGERWLAMHNRPDDQRFFVSLINSSSRPMDFDLTYPFVRGEGPPVEPVTTRVTVPPRGARLHEVVLRPMCARAVGDRLMHLRCRSSDPGGRKINFFCASPDLTQFSIDHV